MRRSKSGSEDYAQLRKTIEAMHAAFPDMTTDILKDPSAGPQALSKIPLGRVGTPEEIAGCILFLCTDHAGFITGEIMNVNGGAVLVG